MKEREAKTVEDAGSREMVPVELSEHPSDVNARNIAWSRRCYR